MKNIFINYTYNFINKHKRLNHYDQIKTKYGLEVMYHFVTKTVVVLIMSALLNILLENIFIFIFFGLLRTFSHGIHANSNLQCWIFTLLTYFVFGLSSKYINFNFSIKLFISLFTILSLILFSPSDTKYRPIRNMYKRRKLKIYSIVVSILYSIFCLYFNNSVSNALIISMVLICISINPLTYLFFNSSRNNYKVPT